MQGDEAESISELRENVVGMTTARAMEFPRVNIQARRVAQS